jgi:hypothetical protein
VLKTFCDEQYELAKSDIATVFLDRCFKLSTVGGVVSLVMPQNWLFQSRSEKQRVNLLSTKTWLTVAVLGEGGFESAGAAGAFTALFMFENSYPSNTHATFAIDASQAKRPEDKARILLNSDMTAVAQQEQLGNPNAVFSMHKIESGTRLENYAFSVSGLKTGDVNRFNRKICELGSITSSWELIQQSAQEPIPYTGLDEMILWEGGYGELYRLAEAVKGINHVAQNWRRGQDAWGKFGVAVTAMRNVFSNFYRGNLFDSNVTAVIPTDQAFADAIYAFCSSDEFEAELRKIDKKLSITTATLLKVPFNLIHWQQVAAERYPNGLPKPYSDDPTQWIFHGHPQPSKDPLQVAVARLLGYRWPAEADTKMELSDEAKSWIARCKELDGSVDDDGILCLPAVRGEASAVERLRAVLAKAFGKEWSAVREAQLLKDTGSDGIPLAQWLRDKFFEQHVARFQKRPFIWHVWDGHKDGFSALLNYHTLTRAKLQTLIHTYLGDWITQQRRAVDARGSQAGDATLKLAKAEALKVQLEAIAQGEEPFDIFVRWKPLNQQPIGWDPDLNDGVRMNIRPFVQAGVLRINQTKLGIKWESDRGKDVATAPWFKLGPTYGEPEGTRINNHHLSLAEKHAARTKVK